MIGFAKRAFDEHEEAPRLLGRLGRAPGVDGSSLRKTVPIRNCMSE